MTKQNVFTNFPNGPDNFGAGIYDPGIGLAVDAIETVLLPPYGLAGDIDMNIDAVSPIDIEIQFPYVSIPFYPGSIVLGGNFSGGITIPSYTYAPGATIMTFVTQITTLSTPSLVDEYDTAIRFYILNYTGGGAKIGGGSAIAKGQNSAIITPAECTRTAIASATDITYNTSTGVIATTAGGLYGVVAQLIGYWHGL